MLSATLFGFAFAFAFAFAFGFACNWRRFSIFVFARASAIRYLASSVAPVRGGTYFSLPPQRTVGKRKRLTPPTSLIA
ncbi:hypothetical protein [Paraburkholderia terrae]